MHENGYRSFWLSMFIWLALGGLLGYFVYETIMARVDWPVAFSAESDFVPVLVYPVDAQVTRDWSRFGGQSFRDETEQIYAVWLTVMYKTQEQIKQGRVKYAGRMSWCGANGNAQWAMQPENHPLQILMSSKDPSILTSSTSQANRESEVIMRVAVISAITLVWLGSPFYLWQYMKSHANPVVDESIDSSPPEQRSQRMAGDSDASGVMPGLGSTITNRI